MLSLTLGSCATSVDIENKALVNEKKNNPVVSKIVLSEKYKKETIKKIIKVKVDIDKSKKKSSQIDPEEVKLIDSDTNEITDKFATINFDLSNLRSRLIGMDEDGIRGMLGFPAFKRSEPPVKIWQYRTQVCIVNVFLYKKDKQLMTKYVASLGRNKKQVDDEICFESILMVNPTNKNVS